MEARLRCVEGRHRCSIAPASPAERFVVRVWSGWPDQGGHVDGPVPPLLDHASGVAPAAPRRTHEREGYSAYEKSYTRDVASRPIVDLQRVSGLSIAVLARRAGVSRASVSEYVHGHRQPGVGQLERLAAAAGRRMLVTFPPAWDRRRLDLEDVLALADALPLRPQPPRTRTWRELTGR